MSKLSLYKSCVMSHIRIWTIKVLYSQVANTHVVVADEVGVRDNERQRGKDRKDENKRD